MAHQEPMEKLFGWKISGWPISRILS